MVMKNFDQDKSDRWIRKKMSKHIGGTGSGRELIRQKLDNGYGDSVDNHAIYYLAGSPIKAYAVRVDTRISFYEQNGRRWAEYSLGRNDITHDVSKTNRECLNSRSSDQQ